MKKTVKTMIISAIVAIITVFGSCSKTTESYGVDAIAKTGELSVENLDGSRSILRGGGGHNDMGGNPPPTGSSTLSPGGGN